MWWWWSTVNAHTLIDMGMERWSSRPGVLPPTTPWMMAYGESVCSQGDPKELLQEMISVSLISHWEIE